MKKPNYVFRYCEFCCKKLKTKRLSGHHFSTFISKCKNKKCIWFNLTQAYRIYSTIRKFYFFIESSEHRPIEAEYYYESAFWINNKTFVKKELSVKDFFKTFDSISKNLIFE